MITRYITLAERLAENEFTQGDNKDYPQIRINDYVEVRIKTNDNNNPYSAGTVTSVDNENIYVCNNQFPTKYYKFKKVDSMD